MVFDDDMKIVVPPPDVMHELMDDNRIRDMVMMTISAGLRKIILDKIERK
jgi:hypothetical protein